MRSRHGFQDRLDEQRPLRNRLLHGSPRIDPLAMEPRPTPQRHAHRGSRPGNRRAAASALVHPHLRGSSASANCWPTSGSSCSIAPGGLRAEEKTFIPESEYGKVVIQARIYLLIYASVIALSIFTGSILPLIFVGLPAIYGSWLLHIYGFTQHAGLAENVLDHRLNCRTVYMNFIHRYLYWNMNYHVEHHMFPLVPYHNLPRLHALVKADMPKPYSGLWEAWREIIPAVLRQAKDPSYYVERKLPTPSIRADAPRRVAHFHREGPAGEWLGRDLRRQLPAKRRCHPLRPRRQDLRHLPHRRRRSLRHRRPLHA